MVVRRGRQRGERRCRWRAGRARPGVILRFIEYMDVGTRTAGGSTRSCPAAELVGDDRRGDGRSSRPTPNYRGEVADRWRYLDGGGRVRGHLVGDPAVLRRLHARAAVGRGQAVHVPVRGRRARPARRVLRAGASGRGARARSSRRSGASAATATRSCARPRRRPAARSRCSRWAAETAPEPGFVHRLVHSRAGKFVDGGRGPPPEFVDNRVDPPAARPVPFVLPEGADRTEGPEITSRTSAPPPVASGASLPGTGAAVYTAGPRAAAPDGT